MSDTNKDLKNKVKELENIVSGLLQGWKAKHPEDFKLPSNFKLINGSDVPSTLCEHRWRVGGGVGNIKDNEIVKEAINIWCEDCGKMIKAKYKPYEEINLTKRNVEDTFCECNSGLILANLSEGKGKCPICNKSKKLNNRLKNMSKMFSEDRQSVSISGEDICKCDHERVTHDIKGCNVCSCIKFRIQDNYEGGKE